MDARTPKGSKWQATPILWRPPAALQTYLERIGAVARNHRSYVVQREGEDGKNRYRRDLTTVRIRPDGTLSVRVLEPGPETEEHQPTAVEVEAIKAAILEGEADEKTRIPSPLTQTNDNAELLRQSLDVAESHWFVFRDASGTKDSRKPSSVKFHTYCREKVICCQQRIDNEDGTKDYIFWTYWHDGRWRPIEPDGKLPLWKPRKLTHQACIMIHEGGRAARYCDWLCNDDSKEAKELRKTHPWYEYLRCFEHWGWAGGALRPHGTDWKEVIDFKAHQIILVCDYDRPGMDASGPITKKFKGRKFFVAKFDARFPDRWDFAKPLPEFEKGIVPPFEDFVRPATWATEENPKVKGENKVITCAINSSKIGHMRSSLGLLSVKLGAENCFRPTNSTHKCGLSLM
jgi:hypothetical protein